MSCGNNDIFSPPIQDEIKTLNMTMQQDDMQDDMQQDNMQQNIMQQPQNLFMNAEQLEANKHKENEPLNEQHNEQLNAQYQRQDNAEAVQKLNAEERAMLRPSLMKSKPVLLLPLEIPEIKLTLSRSEFKSREKLLRELPSLTEITNTYVEPGALPLLRAYRTTVKKFPSAMLANKPEFYREEKKTWDGLENRYYNTLADNKTKDPDVEMPGTAYVKAAMKMDSWLKGDEAKELMSPDAAVRHQVIDKLVTKALEYQLDEKMFTTKSFEKNGGQIIEMALFYPGLLDLVQQESQRSGYTAQDKEQLLTTRNDTVQTLYSGFGKYAQIQGVKLGNVNQGNGFVRNAQLGILEEEWQAARAESKMIMSDAHKLEEEAMELRAKAKDLSAKAEQHEDKAAAEELMAKAEECRAKSGELTAKIEELRDEARKIMGKVQTTVVVENVPDNDDDDDDYDDNRSEYDNNGPAYYEDRPEYNAADNYDDTDTYKMDPMSITRERVIQINDDKEILSDIQQQYGQNLQQCREKELDYRYQKQDPAQEVVKKAVEPQQVEKVNEKVDEKVTEKVDALLKEREYESTLGVRIAEYTQVEQEERKAVVESDKQLDVTHQLNVAQFDKKMVSPLSAKELKAQEKQRKKAIRQNGAGMGVTHRTAQLQEAINNGDKELAINKYYTTSFLQHESIKEKAREQREKKQRQAANRSKITVVKGAGGRMLWPDRKPHDLVEAAKKIEVPKYMSPDMLDVDRWMSESDRFKFSLLSPKVDVERIKGQKMLKSAISKATSLKLNEASFSASFFTSNAQKFQELERGLPTLAKLAKEFKMVDSEPEIKLDNYAYRFKALNTGFKAFLANNGVNVSEMTAFPQHKYENTEEYRKQYRLTVQANTNTMKVAYDEYIKVLRGE